MAGVSWRKTRTPGVYKRPSARKPGENLYRVVFRDGTGRQVTKNFARLADAENFKKAVDVRRPDDVAAGRIGLKDVYLQMVAAHEAGDEAYAPSTLALHEQVWKHLEPLGDKDVSRISPPAVDAVLKAIPGASIRDKSRRVLSTVYAFAIEKRYVNVSPVRVERKRTTRTARMRNHAEAGQRHRILTEDELASLVTEMPERYRALVELMAYAGLRPGEAVALTVGKLDSLRRRLTVNTSLTGFTKTGEPREIALPNVVAEMLTDHIARFSEPSDPNAPMFPKEDGSAIASKHSYDAFSRRHFREAAKRAGVNHGLSPNDMRHMAAARAIGAGADVYSVAKMLGHAKPSITLDVYGYLWDGRYEDVADRLDGRIRAARAERPKPAEVVSLRF
jgi:integrase